MHIGILDNWFVASAFISVNEKNNINTVSSVHVFDVTWVMSVFHALLQNWNWIKSQTKRCSGEYLRTARASTNKVKIKLLATNGTHRHRCSHINYYRRELFPFWNCVDDEKMVQQTEVGVQDFVLLDEITLERFMDNLHTRWVGRRSSAASSDRFRWCGRVLVLRTCVWVVVVFVGILSSELSETNRPT